MAGFLERFKSNDKKEELKHHVFHLFSTFEMLEFAQSLMDWIANEKKWEATILQTATYPILQYRTSSKLSATQTFHLTLEQKNKELTTLIYASEWIENYHIGTEKQLEKTNWLADSHADEINQKIGELIVEQFKSKIPTETIFVEPIESKYIEKITIKMQCFLYAFLNLDETILSFLQVSAIKKGIKEIPKEYDLHLLLTNKRILLIANQSQFQEVIIEDFSGLELTVIDEVGRDPVTVGEYHFLTQLSNDVEFRAIAPLCNAEPITRAGKMALLQLLTKEAKSETFQIYIKQLFDKQIQIEPENFYHVFVEKILHFFSPQAIAKIGEDNEKVILGIFEKYLNTDEQAGQELLTWFIDWQFKEEFLLQLLELLTKHIENPTIAKRIVPLYEKSQEHFLAKEKNQDKIIEFQLKFAEFLVFVGEREKGSLLYEEIYQKLPDETLNDLLLPTSVNIQEGEGGQLLKITLLEKMIEAKGDIEIPDSDTALRLAQLQPLVKNRLLVLKEVGTDFFVQKVDTILEILETNKLNQVPSEHSITYETLKKEKIENCINHVAHTKGGIFDSMQQLLATVKIPNQSVIKEYAEKVGPKNYAWIQVLIIEMTHALNMPSPEVYIARGDNALQIKAFEGSPSFIVIGVDYLKEESQYYLTPDELRFALAIEIAHLYFGHSRITSTDVWRGATDKGMFVLNTVLSIVPGLSFITSSFDRLKRVSNILEKVGNVSEKIRDFSEGHLKDASFFSEEEKQEQELLAISRLMELISDRLALVLLKGDLHTVIRSMLLTNPKYTNELLTIEHYGLTGMLSKKNAQDEFIYQELAIRLHSICSFYLSKDYEEVKEELFH